MLFIYERVSTQMLVLVKLFMSHHWFAASIHSWRQVSTGRTSGMWQLHRGEWSSALASVGASEERPRSWSTQRIYSWLPGQLKYNPLRFLKTVNKTPSWRYRNWKKNHPTSSSKQMMALKLKPTAWHTYPMEIWGEALKINAGLSGVFRFWDWSRWISEGRICLIRYLCILFSAGRSKSISSWSR